MTGRLERLMTIACPYGQAMVRLDRFFRSHASSDGDFTLALRFDAGTRDIVFATVRAEHRASDSQPRYRLDWATADPGPVPLFSGSLSVENHGEYGSFTLVFKGEYEPPFGPFGASFDVAAGTEAASAAMIDLLQRAQKFIANDFAADQARETERIGNSRLVDLGVARQRKTAAFDLSHGIDEIRIRNVSPS